jgi:site-specific DNA-methyltransferase (adenine-specific)
MVAFEDSGFLVRDILAWEKTSAHYRAQSLAKLYERRGMREAAAKWEGWRLGNLAPIFEPILWLFKPYRIGGTIADNVLEYGVGAMNTGECQANGRNPSNVLRFDFGEDEKRYHEAQKPVSILDYLIRLTTLEGALVLDPFAGSGSTGVACAMNGRRFVGFEQNEAHADVARKRISGTTRLLVSPRRRGYTSEEPALF